MFIKEVLDKTVKFFQEKGFDSARLDAELLLAHALKLERIQLYLKFEQPLKEEELNISRELVRRRAQGEPVAYIIGEKGFFNQTFKVGPGVLVPRPETEHLVESALEWANKNPKEKYIIVDLGCGSGCIGLSLLKELPKAYLLSIDISQVALDFTHANAELLGVQVRAEALLCDAENVEVILSKIKEMGFEKIDMLISNPPYISSDDTNIQKSVKDFEPPGALFADDNGLFKLKRWSKAYAPYLATPGLMLMEMGHQQGLQMKNYFEELNLKEISIKKDLSGHDRVIRGEQI